MENNRTAKVIVFIHSFPSSRLGTHTLEALLPGPCIRPTHATSHWNRRDGPPVFSGYRSRASGTLVSKLELGNERLIKVPRIVVYSKKKVQFSS